MQPDEIHAAKEYVSGLEQWFSYPTGEILNIAVSLMLMGIGILMLWASKRILRGTKFFILLPFEKIKEVRERRKQTA